MRPSFPSIFMKFAVNLSERSTCLRGTKVGCVIVTADNRHVLSLGYNGNARGLANACDRVGPEAVGNCGCIHAEMNAVVHCDAAATVKKIVYCTHLPCSLCAKLLINLGGVDHIYYLNDYRKREGLEHLAQAHIPAEQLKPDELS